MRGCEISFVRDLVDREDGSHVVGRRFRIAFEITLVKDERGQRRMHPIVGIRY